MIYQHEGLISSPFTPIGVNSRGPSSSVAPIGIGWGHHCDCIMAQLLPLPTLFSFPTFSICWLRAVFVVFSCSVMSSSFVTPWTVACPTPLSMEFSRQEYWSRLPFLPPGDLPDPGIELVSHALQTDSLLLCHPGSLILKIHPNKSPTC